MMGKSAPKYVYHLFMPSWTGKLHLVAVVWEPIEPPDLHVDSCVGTTIIFLVGEIYMPRLWRGLIADPTSKFLHLPYNHADRV